METNGTPVSSESPTAAKMPTGPPVPCAFWEKGAVLKEITKADTEPDATASDAFRTPADVIDVEDALEISGSLESIGRQELGKPVQDGATAGAKLVHHLNGSSSGIEADRLGGLATSSISEPLASAKVSSNGDSPSAAEPTPLTAPSTAVARITGTASGNSGTLSVDSRNSTSGPSGTTETAEGSSNSSSGEPTTLASESHSTATPTNPLEANTRASSIENAQQPSITEERAANRSHRHSAAPAGKEVPSTSTVGIALWEESSQSSAIGQRLVPTALRAQLQTPAALKTSSTAKENQIEIVPPSSDLVSRAADVGSIAASETTESLDTHSGTTTPVSDTLLPCKETAPVANPGQKLTSGLNAGQIPKFLSSPGKSASAVQSQRVQAATADSPTKKLQRPRELRQCVQTATAGSPTNKVPTPEERRLVPNAMVNSPTDISKLANTTAAVVRRPSARQTKELQLQAARTLLGKVLPSTPQASAEMCLVTVRSAIMKNQAQCMKSAVKRLTKNQTDLVGGKITLASPTKAVTKSAHIQGKLAAASPTQGKEERPLADDAKKPATSEEDAPEKAKKLGEATVGSSMDMPEAVDHVVDASSTPSVAEAEPSVAEAEPPVAEAEPSVAEAEPSVAEAEPSVAEAEPSVAEAESGSKAASLQAMPSMSATNDEPAKQLPTIRDVAQNEQSSGDSRSVVKNSGMAASSNEPQSGAVEVTEKSLDGREKASTAKKSTEIGSDLAIPGEQVPKAPETSFEHPLLVSQTQGSNAEQVSAERTTPEQVSKPGKIIAEIEVSSGARTSATLADHDQESQDSDEVVFVRNRKRSRPSDQSMPERRFRTLVGHTSSSQRNDTGTQAVPISGTLSTSVPMHARPQYVDLTSTSHPYVDLNATYRSSNDFRWPNLTPTSLLQATVSQTLESPRNAVFETARGPYSQWNRAANEIGVTSAGTRHQVVSSSELSATARGRVRESPWHHSQSEQARFHAPLRGNVSAPAPIPIAGTTSTIPNGISQVSSTRLQPTAAPFLSSSMEVVRSAAQHAMSAAEAMFNSGHQARGSTVSHATPYARVERPPITPALNQQLPFSSSGASTSSFVGRPHVSGSKGSFTDPPNAQVAEEHTSGPNQAVVVSATMTEHPNLSSEGATFRSEVRSAVDPHARYASGVGGAQPMERPRATCVSDGLPLPSSQSTSFTALAEARGRPATTSATGQLALSSGTGSTATQSRRKRPMKKSAGDHLTIAGKKIDPRAQIYVGRTKKDKEYSTAAKNLYIVLKNRPNLEIYRPPSEESDQALATGNVSPDSSRSKVPSLTGNGCEDDDECLVSSSAPGNTNGALSKSADAKDGAGEPSSRPGYSATVSSLSEKGGKDADQASTGKKSDKEAASRSLADLEHYTAASWKKIEGSVTQLVEALKSRLHCEKISTREFMRAGFDHAMKSHIRFCPSHRVSCILLQLEGMYFWRCARCDVKVACEANSKDLLAWQTFQRWGYRCLGALELQEREFLERVKNLQQVIESSQREIRTDSAVWLEKVQATLKAALVSDEETRYLTAIRNCASLSDVLNEKIKETERQGRHTYLRLPWNSADDTAQSFQRKYDAICRVGHLIRGRSEGFLQLEGRLLTAMREVANNHNISSATKFDHEDSHKKHTCLSRDEDILATLKNSNFRLKLSEGVVKGRSLAEANFGAVPSLRFLVDEEAAWERKERDKQEAVEQQAKEALEQQAKREQNAKRLKRKEPPRPTPVFAKKRKLLTIARSVVQPSGNHQSDTASQEAKENPVAFTSASPVKPVATSVPPRRPEDESVVNKPSDLRRPTNYVEFGRGAGATSVPSSAPDNRPPTNSVGFGREAEATSVPLNAINKRPPTNYAGFGGDAGATSVPLSVIDKERVWQTNVNHRTSPDGFGRGAWSETGHISPRKSDENDQLPAPLGTARMGLVPSATDNARGSLASRWSLQSGSLQPLGSDKDSRAPAAEQMIEALATENRRLADQLRRAQFSQQVLLERVQVLGEALCSASRRETLGDKRGVPDLGAAIFGRRFWDDMVNKTQKE